MFDKRFRRYIQTLLLVLPMTLIVCVVNTLVARGIDSVLTMATLQKWGISIVVAYPSALVILPFVIKLTDKMTKKD